MFDKEVEFGACVSGPEKAVAGVGLGMVEDLLDGEAFPRASNDGVG